MSTNTVATTLDAAEHGAGNTARGVVVALIAFLTLVDLFAAQAILPSLAQHYRVSPGAIGFAVNACTAGMAVSSLTVALLARHIDRRWGIVTSLALLAVPTTLLAFAPDLTTFTWLRVAQGVLMAAAFTLTLAHLGETYRDMDAASVFAAYVTGNVASNLFGRMLSAAVADHLGLAANFFVFAALNVAGGLLVLLAFRSVPAMMKEATPAASSQMTAAWRAHLGNPELRTAFALGFCILFAFIGSFSYVGFVLRAPPISLGAMSLGFVYLVFLPSVLTTPLAGAVAGRLGFHRALLGALALAAAGLPLLLSPSLTPVLAGLVMVGVGTFMAQALTTGFVGRVARADRGAASGLYLAAYFSGGLVGSAILGQMFDRWGWPACVMGIAASLVGAFVLGSRLREPGVSR